MGPRHPFRNSRAPFCATEEMAAPARLLRSSLSQGRACHLLTRRLPVSKLSAAVRWFLTAWRRNPHFDRARASDRR